MLRTETLRKPKLNKYIKAYKQTIKTKKCKEKRRARDRIFTSTLDFDRSPQSIYSQPNQNELVKLRIWRSRPEKVPIKQNLTWGYFVKSSLFDSLFSSESCVFYHCFHLPLKKCLLWLYIVEKQGFRAAPRWGDSFQTKFNAEKKLSLYSFLNPCYVRKLVHVYASPCIHAHAISMRMHGLSVRAHT